MLVKGIRTADSSAGGKNKDLEMIFVNYSQTPKPALNPKYPRLYGHALCPYVERVRLSFAARNVEY